MSAEAMVGETSHTVSLLRGHVRNCANRIVDGYIVCLNSERNGLLVLGDEALRHSAIHMLSPVLTGDPGSDRLIEGVAHARAEASVSPYDSFRAVKHLYEITADVITEGAENLGSTAGAISIVLRDLHHAVFARVQGAALPYAHHLLEQISAAHLDERKRMARDLHDHAGQSIAAAMLQAELYAEELRQVLPGSMDGPETIMASLRDASQAIHDVASEIGRSSFVTDLPSALSSWIERHGSQRVQLDVDGRGAIRAIPAWMQDQLYLAVREAIRNALAHTEDDLIKVCVGTCVERFQARIADHGNGIPAELLPGASSSGKGLGAMRDRIELLSGTVEVSGGPHEGTTVKIEVPLTP